MHEKDRASADHTTLLLNCYTKLKEETKLRNFIRGSSPDGDNKLKFDVETAITVLREAGCIEDALYLAKAHLDHDMYLKIQLEDVKNHKDALDYISHLAFPLAEKHAKTYGKVCDLFRRLMLISCTIYYIASSC
jgi:hypothetical protein